MGNLEEEELTIKKMIELEYQRTGQSVYAFRELYRLYSDTCDEHIEDLKSVLEELVDYGFLFSANGKYGIKELPERIEEKAEERPVLTLLRYANTPLKDSLGRILYINRYSNGKIDGVFAEGKIENGEVLDIGGLVCQNK